LRLEPIAMVARENSTRRPTERTRALRPPNEPGATGKVAGQANERKRLRRPDEPGATGKVAGQANERERLSDRTNPAPRAKPNEPGATVETDEPETSFDSD
jgi:hypothetical protein